MKLEKSKHAHNLTKLLKVCLFGMVMILPFLAILPSTLYFAFNEHAQNYTHETVNTTYEYETNEVNSVDDLVVGNIYKASLPTDITLNSVIVYTSYFRTETNYIATMDETGDYSRLAITKIINNTYFQFVCYNSDYTKNIYLPYKAVEDTTSIDFYFVYLSSSGITANYINDISASDYLGEKNVEVISSEQSPLKAFYSASNELWQQPMFNWVNTGLGGIAIANMLSVFGIGQNTFISNILIYWLSITAIYIIIDIVIELFVALTHLIGKKAE